MSITFVSMKDLNAEQLKLIKLITIGFLGGKKPEQLGQMFDMSTEVVTAVVKNTLMATVCHAIDMDAPSPHHTVLHYWYCEEHDLLDNINAFLKYPQYWAMWVCMMIVNEVYPSERVKKKIKVKTPMKEMEDRTLDSFLI